jgi:hypothetical protein
MEIVGAPSGIEPASAGFGRVDIFFIISCLENYLRSKVQEKHALGNRQRIQQDSDNLLTAI